MAKLPSNPLGKPLPKGKVNNPVTYVKKSAPKAMSVPDRTHASVSVRKIDNGYIISESCDGPKGYSYKERYSAEKPKIVMPSAQTKK